ncbi:MAG: nucleotidyltransferase family protein [Clostridia bacterium]|nr:nucleotidyltransferase family protein [Clostridia bacterium]
MSGNATKVAIICEYNPFHEGHAFLFRIARESYPGCTVISVMSGNTVQRGDFALFDKFTRARAATACGSDLALELCYPFSASSSKQFAQAGVRLAMEAGADVLMFGTLADDPKSLFDVANVMKTDEFNRRLGEMAKADPGVSYIKLRERLYGEMTGLELPKDGNSSLGIEYILAAEELSSENGAKALKCHPVKRVGSVSATQCREAIRAAVDSKTELPPEIPPEARKILEGAKIGGGLPSIGSFILGFLRIAAFNRAERYAIEQDNGIRGALINAASDAASFEEFNAALPTATYTRARLRRELLDMMLLPDIPKPDNLKNHPPLFTVLLDANQKGLEALRDMKKSSLLPVITKPFDCRKLSDEAMKAYRIAERADSLFALTVSRGISPSALIPNFKKMQ